MQKRQGEENTKIFCKKTIEGGHFFQKYFARILRNTLDFFVPRLVCQNLET